MAKSSGKVTIKKYANRRLYDTESSAYITLDRLARMVREGREFEVVDAKTGEDITRQVLTQIIVDEEARGSDHAADQFPEAADRPLRQFDADLRAAISRSGDGCVPAQPERGASDAFGGNVFADLAKRNMAMFEDAAEAFAGKPRQRLKRRRRTVMSISLKAELAALQAKVDKLNRCRNVAHYRRGFARRCRRPRSPRRPSPWRPRSPSPGTGPTR